MSTPPPTPATLPTDDAVADRQAALRELAGIGMTVARAVGRHAEHLAHAEPGTAGAAACAGELSLAFTRVSRAVRLTFALEARMEGDGRGAAARAARAADAAAQAEHERAAMAAARRSAQVLCKADDLGEILRDMVEDEADDDEDKGWGGQDGRGEGEARAERLYERLCEQLDAVEPDEVFERPLEELVARICRDLGIEPDLSLYEYEAWVEAAGGLRAVKRAFARVGAEAPLAQPATSAPALEMQPP